MKASRALFKKYLQTNNQKEKNQIEKAFVDDAFVMEAIEGFQTVEGAWQKFTSFDRRKQLKKKRQQIIVLLASAVVSIVIGIFMIPRATKSNTEQHTKLLRENQIIKIHRKEEIQQMQPVAKSIQISPMRILKETSVKNKTNEQLSEALERLTQQPIQPIEWNRDQRKSLKLKIGRELYIKNFKVIDYRYYRSDERTQAHGLTENEWGEQVLHLPYINLLSSAVEHFSLEQYKLALMHFDEILEVYPDDANALFYGGLCLYNLNQLNQAENRLVKLQHIPFGNFDEEGKWYLLHVYQKNKNRSAFELLKTALIEQDGFYSESAKSFAFD